MNKTVRAGLVAGVAILILGVGVNMLANALIPSLQAEYERSGIFRPWEDPLMQLYFAYPFVLGIGLSYVWEKIKSVVKGKTEADRVKNFTVYYFAAATIPGMLITYSSFEISLAMVLSWTVMGLLQGFVMGYVFARMNP